MAQLAGREGVLETAVPRRIGHRVAHPERPVLIVDRRDVRAVSQHRPVRARAPLGAAAAVAGGDLGVVDDAEPDGARGDGGGDVEGEPDRLDVGRRLLPAGHARLPRQRLPLGLLELAAVGRAAVAQGQPLARVRAAAVVPPPAGRGVVQVRAGPLFEPEFDPAVVLVGGAGLAVVPRAQPQLDMRERRPAQLLDHALIDRDAVLQRRGVDLRIRVVPRLRQCLLSRQHGRAGRQQCDDRDDECEARINPAAQHAEPGMSHKNPPRQPPRLVGSRLQ